MRHASRPVSELTAAVAFRTWLIARSRGYDAPEYEWASNELDAVLREATRVWRDAEKLREAAEAKRP